MTSEMVVEGIEIDAQGRWPSMNACPRVRYPSHVLQQTPHLREGQPLVGLHSPTARTQEIHVIASRLECVQRLPIFAHIEKQIIDEFLEFPAFEPRGNGLQSPTSISFGELESEVLEALSASHQSSYARGIEIEVKRLDQMLRLMLFGPSSETLISNALVERVLIDQEQLRSRLGEDVGIGELCEGTQWREFVDVGLQGGRLTRTLDVTSSSVPVEKALL